MDLYSNTGKTEKRAGWESPDLLERFAQGDLDAIEMLFRQFQSKVYAWIMRVVRDPGTAEDLTVETFWRIYRARGRFNPQADFGAWAYRIAINLALSHLRRRPQETELTGDEPAHSADSESQHAMNEHIRRVIHRLPLNPRVLADLALNEARPYPPLAGTCDLATGTVQSNSPRAVRIL